MNSSKTKFFKDIPTKDGLNSICKICRRGSYNKNYEKIIQYRKEYNKNNRSKINAYEKQKRKIDFNFKLTFNIRRRTNEAFKTKKLEKLIKQVI